MTQNRRFLLFFTLVLFLFSNLATAAPRTMRGLSSLFGRPATSSKIKLTAFAMMPRPKQTIQRIMKYRSLGMTPSTRKNLQRFLTLLPRLLPQFQAKNLDDALNRFPQLMQQLGVNTSRPLGILAFDFAGTPYAIASVGLNVRVLRANLQQLGLFSLQSTTLSNGITSHTIVFTFRKGRFRFTKKYFLGLEKQGQLYVLLPYKGNQPLTRMNKVAPKLLRTLLREHPSPFHLLAKKGLTKGEKKRVKQGELDLIASVISGAALRWFGPKARKFQMAQMFVQGTSIEISLKSGFSLRNRLALSALLAPLVQLYSSKPFDAGQWSQRLPADMGAVGHLHLNFDAVSRLLNLFRAFGGKRVVQKYNAQWQALKIRGQQQGVNLPLLYRSLTGEITTGILWNDTVIRQLVKQKFFEGNLEGLLLHVGFDTPAHAHKALKALPKLTAEIRAFMASNLPEYKDIAFKTGVVGQAPVVTATTSGVRPLYLTVKGRFLVVAGGLETLQTQLKAWSSPQLTFAGAVQRSNSLQALLNGKSNQFYLVQPSMVRDVQSFLKTQPTIKIHPILSNVIQRSLLLSLSNSSTGTTLRGKLNLVLSDQSAETALEKEVRKARMLRVMRSIEKKKPTSRPSSQPPAATSQPTSRPVVVRKDKPAAKPRSMVQPAAFLTMGHIAAVYLPLSAVFVVGIPAFSRYNRRSRSSEALLFMRELTSRAVASYQRSTYSSSTPAFACRGMGWVCSHQVGPCHKGKLRYKANPAIWKHACWKQLGFRISRNHYYKVCYRSSGVGEKASFEIKVIGDLDCDGTRSQYSRKGFVDSKNKPIMTGVIVQNQLE